MVSDIFCNKVYALVASVVFFRGIRVYLQTLESRESLMTRGVR